MMDVLLFIAAIVVIASHTLYLAAWLRVRARTWVTSTLVLMALFFLLPPAGFSSLVIAGLAIGSCMSHWWVLRQTRPALLTVNRPSQSHVNERGEITPFPAMQQPGPDQVNDYEGVGQDDEVTFGREKHPTKKSGSKRPKKRSKKGRRNAPASTTDIPTADKPTIEEYLKPRDDFFNDN